MLEGWRRKIQGFSKEEWRRRGGPSRAVLAADATVLLGVLGLRVAKLL
jgi:hypothetical protein